MIKRVTQDFVQTESKSSDTIST